MSIPAMPAKVADEVLDYKIDMTAELAGRLAGPADDTIFSANWTVVALAPAVIADLTVNSSSFDSSSVTVWLQGGTLGNSYEVACEMTTGGGRTYHRSFKLSIKDR